MHVRAWCPRKEANFFLFWIRMTHWTKNFCNITKPRDKNNLITLISITYRQKYENRQLPNSGVAQLSCCGVPQNRIDHKVEDLCQGYNRRGCGKVVPNIPHGLICQIPAVSSSLKASCSDASLNANALYKPLCGTSLTQINPNFLLGAIKKLLKRLLMIPFNCGE